MLVIIAKKVQKAMQGEHPELGLEGVPCLEGLPARNTYCNHDIAQKTLLLRRKGQDVGGRVFPPVLPVQRAHARVRHERHGDLPPGAGRRRRGEPWAKARRSCTRRDDINDEAATF